MSCALAAVEIMQRLKMITRDFMTLYRQNGPGFLLDYGLGWFFWLLASQVRFGCFGRQE